MAAAARRQPEGWRRRRRWPPPHGKFVLPSHTASIEKSLSRLDSSASYSRRRRCRAACRLWQGLRYLQGRRNIWETVGICLNQLIYRKVAFLSTFFEKKNVQKQFASFFFDMDGFEVSSPNQFLNCSDEHTGYIRYGTLLCSLYGAFMILYVGIICIQAPWYMARYLILF